MSQHKFKTKLPDGKPVEVLAGWDRPLQGFFLVIFPDDPEADYLYSNLDHTPAHPASWDIFQKVLDQHGIEIPAKMREALHQDKAENAGNKVVIW